jgi:hypothetical protein
MICKSRYIQYDKMIAYLHKQQGRTAGKNKYHNSTIENFHIKKYTSQSHCYYISTCCLVLAFECFAHSSNGLFITRNSQITVERNILIQSHCFRALPHPVTWRCVFGALCNTLHSFVRLMSNFVRGIYSDSPHSFCKISKWIRMLNQTKVSWSVSGKMCSNLCKVP